MAMIKESDKSGNYKMTFAGGARSCPGFGLLCTSQGRPLQIKETHSKENNSTYSKTYEAKVPFERNIKTWYLSQQAYCPTTYESSQGTSRCHP
jgi:hypothetical protein